MTRQRGKCFRCGEPTAARGRCSYHYEKHRKQLHARGEFESTYMPAERTIAHIQALRDSGFSKHVIAELSGLTPMTVDHLETRSRVSWFTESRILSVPLPTSPLDPRFPDAARVPAIGSTRRVRALCAIGWPRPYIVERLGAGDPRMLPLNKLYQGRLPQVTAKRARDIAALFDELETRTGPNESCMRYASRAGWFPPLAWHEHTIDDPDAEPDVAALKRPTTLTQDTFREEYLDLRDQFELSDHAIAERLNLSYEALVKRLLRIDLRPQSWAEPVAS